MFSKILKIYAYFKIYFRKYVNPNIKLCMQIKFQKLQIYEFKITAEEVFWICLKKYPHFKLFSDE